MKVVTICTSSKKDFSDEINRLNEFGYIPVWETFKFINVKKLDGYDKNSYVIIMKKGEEE